MDQALGDEHDMWESRVKGTEMKESGMFEFSWISINWKWKQSNTFLKNLQGLEFNKFCKQLYAKGD